MHGRAAGRLAGCLDRRQEQGDQNADDRDDHQQFDQGEPRKKGKGVRLRTKF